MRHKRALFMEIIIITVLLSLLVACTSNGGGSDMQNPASNSIDIKTDTQPIYNHFPSLPETGHILWCSASETDGMGLDKYDLYFFAFFQPEILTAALDGVSFVPVEQAPDLYFVPDELVDKTMAWQRYKGTVQLFQDGVAIEKQLPATYYADFDNGVLYVHASWD